MAKQSLSDLKRKLKQLEASIVNELENIAVQMANDGKALAQRRIIESGLPGERYSEEVVPAFFLSGKTLNPKGDAFLKRKAKKGELTNWRELRIAQGLQAKFIDLYYSGDMWQNITVVKINKKSAQALAILGGKTKSSQDKMNWNRDRYGNFIQDNLSSDDTKFLQRIAANKVNAIINSIQL